MNKTLKIALVISLIANVLLLGVVLGGLPQRLYGAPPGRIRLAVEQLPEPARTRFRQKLEQARDPQNPLREQMRQAREEAIRLLATEPFDEAAYDGQVEKISLLRLQLARRMSDDIKEVVKGLPLVQRQAVAEILRRPPGSRD